MTPQEKAIQILENAANKVKREIEFVNHVGLQKDMTEENNELKEIEKAINFVKTAKNY